MRLKKQNEPYGDGTSKNIDASVDYDSQSPSKSVSNKQRSCFHEAHLQSPSDQKHAAQPPEGSEPLHKFLLRGLRSAPGSLTREEDHMNIDAANSKDIANTASLLKNVIETTRSQLSSRRNYRTRESKGKVSPGKTTDALSANDSNPAIISSVPKMSSIRPNVNAENDISRGSRASGDDTRNQYCTRLEPSSIKRSAYLQHCTAETPIPNDRRDLQQKLPNDHTRKNIVKESHFYAKNVEMPASVTASLGSPPSEGEIAAKALTVQKYSPHSSHRTALIEKQEQVDYMKFECHQEGCLARFSKKKALRCHKEQNHEYCMQHDLDFQEWEELVAHKVSSPDHITCVFCGSDFKTEGGRERHAIVEHPKKQDCECPGWGCEERFTNAAGMITHIEKGLCRYITPIQFVKLRFTKGALGGHIEEMDYREENLKLKAREECAPPKIDNQIEFPTLTSNRPGSIKRGSDSISSPHTRNTKPNVSCQESADCREHGAVCLHSQAYSVPRSTEHDTIQDIGQHKGDAHDPDLSIPLIRRPLCGMPKDQATRMQRLARIMWGENAFKSAERIFDPFGTGETRKNPWHEDFDPNYFQHPPNSGIFPCPYSWCSKSYREGYELQNHLKSSLHSKWEVKCPQCFKAYKTAASLVSHMEAPSFKCRIKESNYFSEVLQIATSGFVAHELKGQDHHFTAAEPFSRGEN